MFTVVKVREDLAPNDYRDPGPYKFPQGTVTYAVDAGNAGEAVRLKSGGAESAPSSPQGHHTH
jgi:hypothetical protein